MRVLFVANRCPGALTRGDQLRAFEHIRHLSSRHAITLLCFDPAAPAHALDALRACCERVIVAPRGRLGMGLRALAALPTSRPLQVAMHAGVPAGVDLPALLAQGRFDLVHLQLARLGELLPRLSPVPVVLDFVDALSLNMRRRAALDRGPMRLLARIEAGRLARYERALLPRVAAAAVCSAADRKAIGGGAALHQVGNGVDIARFAPPPMDAPRDGIVFLGNLGYFPNVDAAEWFTQQVFDAVRAARASTRLRLVGARPAPALRRLAARHAGVELVGEVPDVRPYLQRAAVAVVPLRAGSGQQLKLLEAMACGTPVVATTMCAAALGAEHGEHLLVADEPAAMADAVLRLLDDADLAGRIAASARAFVAQHWTWAASAGALDAVWCAAAGSAAQR